MIKLHAEDGGAKVYELSNDKLSLLITNYGAAIYAARIKRNGALVDIALTCDSIADFMKNKNFYGATVGRTVNRIKNGRFSLNGKEYQLTLNEGNNSAHGGNIGFSSRLWESAVDGDKLVMTLRSADGEEGYPGNLDVCVKYSLKDGCIVIEHEAVCDADTVVNLTNHTYWCIDGIGVKVYEQRLRINADEYLETDDELIPTGRKLPVNDTPYDFRVHAAVGARINEDVHSLRRHNGYDLSYVKRPSDDGFAAELRSADGSVALDVYSTYPDIHLYTGNFLNDEPGVSGSRYNAHDALCLESSYFPDGVNHADFGKYVLKKGETLKEQIIYKLTF